MFKYFSVIFILVTLFSCKSSKSSTDTKDDYIISQVTLNVNQIYLLENTGDKELIYYLKEYGDPYSVYFYNFDLHFFEKPDGFAYRLASNDKVYFSLKKMDSRASNTTDIYLNSLLKLTSIDEIPDESIIPFEFDFNQKYQLTNTTDKNITINFSGMFYNIVDDYALNGYRIYKDDSNYDPERLEDPLILKPNKPIVFEILAYEHTETGTVFLRENPDTLYLIDGLTIEVLVEE